VQHVMLTGGPFEERPDRQQPLRLGSEAERFAVRLAVVEQPALVTLEHRPGHLGGASDATLVQPVDEVGEHALTVLDRARAVAVRAHPIAELADTDRDTITNVIDSLTTRARLRTIAGSGNG
jgi:hypothetical protein